MGNRENTAINELVARVSGGPSNPTSSREAERPEHQGHGQRPELPTSYPVVPRALLAAVTPLAPDPVDPPAPASEPEPAIPSWALSSGGHTPPAETSDRGDEHRVGTLQLHRPSELRVVVGKLVLPIALLVIAGVVIGGYVALRGGDEPGTLVADLAPSGAPAAVASAAPPIAQASPAATPVPAVVQAQPEAPAAARPPPGEPPASLPAFVDVRIDSTPSGATVTLVDRGRSQFVGNTPVDLAVDPSREYDLMFSYPNKPVRVEHLAPAATRRVAVTLDPRASARPADSAPRRAERTGEGTLMISSKPPCEIVIDGKPTGLTTPQRSIVLPAGVHEIMLVNSEKDIRKTISVQITANATEKVIEDLMQ